MKKIIKIILKIQNKLKIKNYMRNLNNQKVPFIMFKFMNNFI